jgi:hypothetical protein
MYGQRENTRRRFSATFSSDHDTPSPGAAGAAVEALEGRRLLCFSAPVVSPGGGDSPAVADFNHDGRDDVAVLAAKGHVVVSLSNGDGTFRQGATLGGVTGTLYSLSAGDFNGDGRSDLRAWGFRSNTTKSPGGNKSQASMTSMDGMVGPAGCLQSCGTPWTPTGWVITSTWLGNGDGSFGAAGSFSTPWYYEPVSGPINPSSTQADFNRDGRVDVASLDGASAGTITVELSNGDGTYQAPLSYVAGRNPGAIASGDFDGDGWADLVVADSLSGGKSTLSVLLNDGLW